MKHSTQVRRQDSAPRTAEQAPTPTDTAPPRNVEQELLIGVDPAEAAAEFNEAFSILEERTQSSLVLALMNTDILREAIGSFAKFEEFDLPGFKEGAKSWAIDVFFYMDSGLEDMRSTTAPLIERLKQSRGAFSPPALVYEDFARIGEEIGCSEWHEAYSSLEAAIGALRHLLEAQSWVLGNRDFPDATYAVAQAQEGLTIWQKRLLMAVNRVKTALVQMELRERMQRQAA